VFFRSKKAVSATQPFVAPDRAARKAIEEQTIRIEAARLCWACPF
jgi:hypothetical protein